MSLTMRILLCFLPLLTLFLTSVETLNCNGEQYEWPFDNPKRCCQKCKRGTFMVTRCEDDKETVCKPCRENYYTDGSNNLLDCQRCSHCIKDHMKYNQNCTRTTDAVCGCESGYKCTGHPCQSCEKIPAPPAPPPAPPTPPSTPPTSKAAAPANTHKTFPDSVWISLSLCCACVCILLTCFILISRHTPVRGRDILASTDCFWFSEKKSSASSSQCTEDEEVPMPVQEEGKENV